MDARPEDDIGECRLAMLDLSTAARAIGAQPGSQARARLNDSVARVLRIFRLHGLEAAPRMSPPEAIQTFRAALRQALEAGAPRHQLVAIFNGEEDAAERGQEGLAMIPDEPPDWFDYADDIDRDDHDGDEFDDFDCALRPDGQCGKAGSEECEFDCPVMREMRNEDRERRAKALDRKRGPQLPGLEEA